MPRKSDKQREIHHTLSILNRPDRPISRGEVLALKWAIEKAEQYNIVKNEETGVWYVKE